MCAWQLSYVVACCCAAVHMVYMLLVLCGVLLQMRACAQKDLEVIEKGEKKPAMAKFTALQHVSQLTAPC